jgi:hypothetical protein
MEIYELPDKDPEIILNKLNKLQKDAARLLNWENIIRRIIARR